MEQFVAKAERGQHSRAGWPNTCYGVNLPIPPCVLVTGVLSLSSLSKFALFASCLLLFDRVNHLVRCLLAHCWRHASALHAPCCSLTNTFNSFYMSTACSLPAPTTHVVQPSYAHASAGVSKAALNALTRIMARELAGQEICVNSCCPGWCATDMSSHRSVLPHAPFSAAAHLCLLSIADGHAHVSGSSPSRLLQPATVCSPP